MRGERHQGGSFSTWERVPATYAGAEENRRRTCHVILILALAAVDFGLFRLAYWTLGAVPSALWLILFLSGHLVIFLVACCWRTSVAAALAALLTAMAAPVPVLLGARLLDLRTEAVAIAEFAAAHRAAETHYPASLHDYVFRRPDLKRFLNYRRLALDAFSISYSVDGTFTTSYSCVNRPRRLSTTDAHGRCSVSWLPPEPRGCTRSGDFFYQDD